MAKVLTVEDHPGSRDYLSTLLRYAGHQVLEASDGAEGLEMAHNGHPDLVITDILMPTMDGIEFVRRLRQDPDVAATPVIFYTASYRLAEAENLARSSGVQRVLAKTAAPADLLNTVEDMLSARPAPALHREQEVALEEKLSRTRNELDRVSQRLSAILDASRQLLTLTVPDELLLRLCELAREIVGSRYAVLAVPVEGKLERRFVSGLKGDLPASPTCDGLLKHFHDGDAALRMSGMTGPHEAGLPLAHPPVTSILAARLMGVSEAVGLLYCADKVGAAGFSAEDEYLLISLATQAATAYEKTRLLAEAERRARELAEEVASRHRAEERLLHAQKMDSIGKLAGGISHDFNNLLTVIKGYGEILMTRVKAGDPLHEPAREILSAADRAANLVRQLLAFSRKQVMAPSLLDLNSVVTGMDRLLRRLIGEHIELVTFPGATLGLIRADPSHLEQVVVNLAVNARDAMPDGGKITIELGNVDIDARMAREMGAEPGPFVKLAISDNGVGMNADTLSHIFEPFFTTKEAGRGTGLGLATVYGIVKQSGGHIWVYSEPGHGSTFKVYLPRVSEVATGEAAAHAIAPQEGGSETVLLVEDEASVRRLTRQMLKSSGYTVIEASNGSEALKTADEAKGHIHMVVTDLVMPELGGHHMIQKLREKRPDVRVLYMSGYAGNAITDAGTLEPGAAFIEKPFTPLTFLAKVREVLDKDKS